jgi:hypothetical protein
LTVAQARVRLYEESVRLLEKMTGDRVPNALDSRPAAASVAAGPQGGMSYAAAAAVGRGE